MPHVVSLAELQPYIGQHVKVMKYNGYSSISGNEGHDEYVFTSEFDGRLDTEYTISKVKLTKTQIVFDLVDPTGSKTKAKVNIGRQHNYDGMQSCESFFLVDKFEEARKAAIGTVIYNTNNEPVAHLEDIQYLPYKDSYPKLQWIVQSDLCDSKFSVTPDEAQLICSKFGTIITNPKVVSEYKIVGFKFPSYDSLRDFKFAYYIVQQVDAPIKTHECDFETVETSAFSEDLSGNYITQLASVEKPSNPEIRYGTTTTVEDDNVTKYSYVDNVIDIVIFGGKTQFSFVLKNVSDNSIKIVWNEAVFVDYSGSSSKIMHLGTKYSQRDGDQPASTVIKGAKIEDVAVPNCNVRYDDEWVVDSMYPKNPATEPGQLRLMLPIQIKDVINEYIFIFDVKYVFKYPERIR